MSLLESKKQAINKTIEVLQELNTYPKKQDNPILDILKRASMTVNLNRLADAWKPFSEHGLDSRSIELEIRNLTNCTHQKFMLQLEICKTIDRLLEMRDGYSHNKTNLN